MAETDKVMKVKVTSRDVLNGKFTNTISTIEGYYKEARGDEAVHQSYTASGVRARMEKIKIAMEHDLEMLSKEITLE